MRAVSINDQFAHVGLAAYFRRPVQEDRARVERLATLLLDDRWPWLPWWASYSGVHRRDDRKSIRVGGKNGVAPLIEGMLSPKLAVLDLERSKGDKNFSSVMLDLDRARGDLGYEAPFRMWITCRSAELPSGKTFDAWLTLAHALVAEVDALHATLGAWPTYTMARSDTWLTRVVLDTPTRDYNLGLPDKYQDQISLLDQWSKKLGRTYARHPRWGTYLNAEHVAAIGGTDRIRAEVQPATIEAVGDLTYIQLTPTIETAMTAEAGEKRRRLEAVMEPILVGNEARRRAVAAG